MTDEKPLQRERNVFVYFDNDAKVREPVDAKALIKKVSGPELAHKMRSGVSYETHDLSSLTFFVSDKFLGRNTT